MMREGKMEIIVGDDNGENLVSVCVCAAYVNCVRRIHACKSYVVEWTRHRATRFSK